MNKTTKLKILIVMGIILIILVAILIFFLSKSSKQEQVPVSTIPSLQDDKDYNFSVAVEEIEEQTSTLYTCQENEVPQYLDGLALAIDVNLGRELKNNLVTWKNDKREVLTYNISSTVLDIDLSEYPNSIGVVDIELFISEYLRPTLKYFELEEKKYGNTVIYSGNRSVDGKEIKTGFGLSDYYMIEDGYLSKARILLADIVETNYVAPLITNPDILEQYLLAPEYPKKIVVDTTDLFTLSPENYEGFTPEIRYESCSITELTPKLYFSTCNEEFIYDTYMISGVCDVEYREELYTIPYKGFINAIDPEYVTVQ